MKLDDIWMTELGHHQSLSLEILDHVRIVDFRESDNFESDFRVEDSVVGQLHFTE